LLADGRGLEADDFKEDTAIFFFRGESSSSASVEGITLRLLRVPFLLQKTSLYAIMDKERERTYVEVFLVSSM